MTKLLDQRQPTTAELAERAAAFPLGATLTLEDLEAAGHEHLLDELRSQEPVTWMPALGGWLVTGHAAARETLSGRTATTVEAEQNMVRASLGEMMLTVDGDHHQRMRKPLEGPFRVRTVADRFEGVMLALATELIDAFVERGEVELGEAFATPYAVRMAGLELGFALDDVAKIDGFYSAFAGAMEYDGNPEPQRLAQAARAELNALLHAELAAARAHPMSGADSLTRALALDGRGLSDDEIVAQLRVVMFGAIETMQASVLNTLLLLLQHPDQLAAAMADPELLDGAGEEARRLIPPVAFAERWTREAVTIGGVAIPAEEFIGISILGANRDPEVFEDPLRFDLRRPNAQRAMSFSYGPHACLGLHLARLQSSLALRELLTRLPALELVHADAPAGFAFRRPETMTVRWGR